MVSKTADLPGVVAVFAFNQSPVPTRGGSSIRAVRLVSGNGAIGSATVAWLGNGRRVLLNSRSETISLVR